MIPAQLLPLVPLLAELVEKIAGAGHDPKVEIRRIADSYSPRARAEADVQAAITEKFQK